MNDKLGGDMELLGLRIEYLPAASTVQINGSVSVFEILSLVGIFAALLSLFISSRAARDSAKTRRADFSFRVFQSLMTDDVQTAYLHIEWGEFQYPVTGSPRGFESEEVEKRTDRLLYLLDEIALLVEAGVLSRADQARWMYQGRRVFRDQSIRNYMAFLDQFCRANGITDPPHSPARRMFEMS